MTVHPAEQTNTPAKNISYESVLTRMGSGAVIVTIGFIAGNGLDYIVRIVIARAVGPAAYGLFELAFTLVMFAALVSVFGMSTNIVRLVAQYTTKGDPSRAKGIVLHGAAISLLISCLMLALMWLTSDRIAVDLLDKPQLGAVLPMFLLAIPVFSVGSIWLASLRGATAMKWWTISQNIAPNLFRFLAVLAVFLVASQWLTVEVVVVIYIIGFVVRLAVSSYFVSRQPFMQRSVHAARGMTSTLVVASLPLLLSDLMSELRRNLEVLMLGYFATTTDIGLYGAAVIVGQLLNVPIMALERIFVPVAAQLYGRHQDQEVHKLYQTSARWILYFTAPLLVALMVYAPIITVFLLGPSYAEVAPILQVLAIGYFVNGATGLWEQVLLAKARNVVAMMLRIIWVITSIVLSAILIPRYGYIGAAWSATIPLILIQLQGLATVWWLERAHPFTWAAVRFSIGTFVVFLFFQLINWVLQLSEWQILWLLPVVCCVAYGVSLLFAGLNADDRLIIATGLRRIRKARPSL